jgi:hypothetical protein
MDCGACDAGNNEQVAPREISMLLLVYRLVAIAAFIAYLIYLGDTRIPAVFGFLFSVYLAIVVYPDKVVGALRLINKKIIVRAYLCTVAVLILYFSAEHVLSPVFAPVQKDSASEQATKLISSPYIQELRLPPVETSGYNLEWWDVLVLALLAAFPYLERASVLRIKGIELSLISIQLEDLAESSTQRDSGSLGHGFDTSFEVLLRYDVKVAIERALGMLDGTLRALYNQGAQTLAPIMLDGMLQHLLGRGIISIEQSEQLSKMISVLHQLRASASPDRELARRACTLTLEAVKQLNANYLDQFGEMPCATNISPLRHQYHINTGGESIVPVDGKVLIDVLDGRLDVHPPVLEVTSERGTIANTASTKVQQYCLMPILELPVRAATLTLKWTLLVYFAICLTFFWQHGIEFPFYYWLFGYSWVIPLILISISPLDIRKYVLEDWKEVFIGAYLICYGLLLITVAYGILFDKGFVKLDWQGVSLLFLAGCMPLLSRVTKLKISEFELHLEPEKRSTSTQMQSKTNESSIWTESIDVSMSLEPAFGLARLIATAVRSLNQLMWAVEPRLRTINAQPINVSWYLFFRKRTISWTQLHELRHWFEEATLIVHGVPVVPDHAKRVAQQGVELTKLLNEKYARIVSPELFNETLTATPVPSQFEIKIGDQSLFTDMKGVVDIADWRIPNAVEWDTISQAPMPIVADFTANDPTILSPSGLSSDSHLVFIFQGLETSQSHQLQKSLYWDHLLSSACSGKANIVPVHIRWKSGQWTELDQLLAQALKEATLTGPNRPPARSIETAFVHCGGFDFWNNIFAEAHIALPGKIENIFSQLEARKISVIGFDTGAAAALAAVDSFLNARIDARVLQLILVQPLTNVESAQTFLGTAHSRLANLTVVHQAGALSKCENLSATYSGSLRQLCERTFEASRTNTYFNRIAKQCGLVLRGPSTQAHEITWPLPLSKCPNGLWRAARMDTDPALWEKISTLLQESGALIPIEQTEEAIATPS